tara:strand:+ start:693 stop:1307 length:615 start_codon:yes stop_codon:yes gene_type:complete
MFKKRIKEQNLKNLISISKMLKTIQHFVFYGTLLGLTRENDIIDGDDDVDFLVDIKDKKKLIKIMTKSKSFQLNKKNSNKYFIQYSLKRNNLETFIDFYFYQNKFSKNYIIERHNFLSNISNPNYALHIPKQNIFPIMKNKKFKLVCMPKHPEKMCEYLYGQNWKTPLKKNTGYRMEIVNNKPMLIKRSFIGYLTREIKKKLDL